MPKVEKTRFEIFVFLSFCEGLVIALNSKMEKVCGEVKAS